MQKLFRKMKPEESIPESTESKFKRFPTVYVNHGGGAMPLLGKQPDVVSSLQTIANTIGKPKAIVIVSAHFESRTTTILTNPSPSTDTFGFNYRAKPSFEIIEQVEKLLTLNGIKYKEDKKRGYDHGIFVPLMIMYPKGDIPLICISQPSSLNPSECLKLGKSLEPLRDQNILILGSGSSFHNFNAFFRNKNQEDLNKGKQWDQWLRSTMEHSSPSERINRVINWESAPNARFAHPREEHLTPLFVVVGAAGYDKGIAVDDDHNSQLFSIDVSQYMFGLE